MQTYHPPHHSMTLGARILCAVVRLTQDSEPGTLFSTKEIRDKVEEMYPGSARQPGLQTHVSAHCVVNAPKNVATEQRFLFRETRDRMRLAQVRDLRMNSDWRVSWPNMETCSNEEQELLVWAKELFLQESSIQPNSATPTLLDLAGSAKHLFVAESAAEYISRMNEEWN